MKTKLITAIMILAAGIFSCDDDETIQDPIYEFISFAGDEEVNLGEATASDDGYPLIVQLWAFDPYQQDITVTLDVTASNAQQGVDFTVTPADNVKIPAGRLTSDTVWVKTINNPDANELERTFEIKINTVSQPDVNIGLGLTEPTKQSISFKIQDDECSGNPICIYNTDLTNTINWGGDDVPKPATGVTDKLNNTVTVTGDLIDYGAFSGATLTLTLTPDSPGATTGTATFGEQETGSDSDGYAYKFIEVNSGSYNAATGTISIEYDIYYWDGGWVYWYSVTNDFEVP
jgi:hypothetical protein